MYSRKLATCMKRKSFNTLTVRQKSARLLQKKHLCLKSRTSKQQQHPPNNQQLHEPEDDISNIVSKDNDGIGNCTYNGDNMSVVGPSIIQNYYGNVTQSLNATSNVLLNESYQMETMNLSNTFENFLNLMRQYCLDFNINHIQIRGLLRILRSHACFKRLCKDSRTLLKTSRDKIHFMKVGNGVYWHIGFTRTLAKHLLLFDVLPSVLEVEVNTDGLSLSRSNPSQFWPIQCRVINIPNFKPLIIGIYQGCEKPSDAYSFFQNFLDEVEHLNLLGGILVQERRIPVVFKRFVADAPARALILNHYGHNASEPCSKCKVIGFRYENTMVYLGVDHEKRKDEDYLSEAYDDHQKGPSPLAQLSIAPVTSVLFEIMHLVYIGVTAKCLEAWFTGKYGFSAKLQSALINEISRRYELLEETCPKEFARRPRCLKKFGKFKATELRHFLLYASPVVLHGILPEIYYYHFMLLHSAMRILTSPKHTDELLQKAEGSLKTFVKFAADLYTPCFMSYNVHGLLHLVDDARKHGALENCSAFVYENNMPLFKKNIRNHPRPLQQFSNRLLEKSSIQHLPKLNSSFGNEKCTLSHEDGPIPANVHITEIKYIQYRKYESKKFSFELNLNNCFCKLEDESFGKIQNILVMNDTCFFVIRKFEQVVHFYNKPFPSSVVGVYKCSALSNDLLLIPANNVSHKCYGMFSWVPSYSGKQISEILEGEYVISTLLHTDA